MRPHARIPLPTLLAVITLGALACSRTDESREADGGTSMLGTLAVGRPEAPRSVAGFGRGAPAATSATSATADLARKRGDAEAAAQFAPPPVAPAPAQLPVATVSAATDTGAAPMIIRTGDARVEVDSLERAIAAVQALAARTGATVGSTVQRGGRDELRSATIELRVPAGRFEVLVSGLPPLGRVEHLNVHAQDVGEEYVDVAARVANARRLEERLVRLLATRTGRLEDVLAVERELARVREEIERYEGRLRFLRTRAAVSTLAVTVHEAAPMIASHPGANPVRDALVEAWRRFVATTTGLIVLLGAVLPIALLCVAAWLLARGLRRRWVAVRTAATR